jgi:5-methylcytosine-specific restriction endonuclease McrA
MSNRNLSTTRAQVFGDVETGTECRICGRPVDDGRAKTCSEYCDNIQTAVMGMLNWSSIRRRVIERDNETCQRCGYDQSKRRRARNHISARIDKLAGDRPDSPPLTDRDALDDFDWNAHHERMEEWRDRRDELKERYGDPMEQGRALEVDHIMPIADGGHPFDPGNLQTLCEKCHKAKTADENSSRSGIDTPTREDLNESLFEYVSSDETAANPKSDS